MLLFDYVQALENKTYQSSNQRQNFQSNKPYELDGPTKEILAECTNLKCSKTDLNLPSKDIFVKTPDELMCEDDIAQYVTILKIVIRKYSPQILQQLFDSERKRFPVFEQLLQYSIHEEIMIKNAARLSLLFILKECQSNVRDYMTEYGAPQYAAHVTLFLKSIIYNLRCSIKSGKDHSVKRLISRFEEEIEYLNDIFGLDHEVVVRQFRIAFIQTLVVPILTSIAEQNQDNNESEISYKTDLFLTQKLLQIATNEKFKKEIIELLLPVEIQETRIQYFFTIFNTTSNKEILKFKYKIIKKITNIVSKLNPDFPQICVLRILCVGIETFLQHNDNNGIFLIYTTFAEFLLKYFLTETSDSKMEIKRLDLAYSILEPITRRRKSFNNAFWFEVSTNFSKTLQLTYLELCKRFKFANISNSAFLIDRQYRKFLKKKSNCENASEDIFSLIFNKNNGECRENVDYQAIDLSLQKLFYLRNLCLQLHQKKEKILPLLPHEIQADEQSSTGNYISCEIIVSNADAITCFLRLTTSQVLILQDSGNNKKGTVIFRSYYKDLSWNKYSETLLLKNKIANKTLPAIRLQLTPFPKISIITRTFAIAKQKQNEMLKKKLDDLLETVYNQSNVI